MEYSNIMENNFIDCYTLFFHIVPSKVIPRPVLTKTATAGRPALRVTWTAPGSERRIIRYQVQYRRSGTSWSTKEVTSRSTTLENLPAGTSYQVRVRGVSDVGAGPYSDVGTLSTFRGMVAHNIIIATLIFQNTFYFQHLIHAMFEQQAIDVHYVQNFTVEC